MDMRRTAWVILSGAILSFLLNRGGNLLADWLVSGTHQNYKDDYVEIIILQTFLILPLTSFLVGTFVGILLPYHQWLFAGVCLLPFIIYMLYQAGSETVLLGLVYLGICMLTALLVSWLRTRKALTYRQHV